MQLDYFQLIDRNVDLNLDEDDHGRGAGSHDADLEGISWLPDHASPLDRSDGASSGWLLLGVMKFERMPFLAMVRKPRCAVSSVPASC
jgi:3-hydroxyacyl-[acyl-carrier-protein] dehydratase